MSRLSAAHKRSQGASQVFLLSLQEHTSSGTNIHTDMKDDTVVRPRMDKSPLKKDQHLIIQY